MGRLFCRRVGQNISENRSYLISFFIRDGRERPYGHSGLFAAHFEEEAKAVWMPLSLPLLGATREFPGRRVPCGNSRTGRIPGRVLAVKTLTATIRQGLGKRARDPFHLFAKSQISPLVL